MIPDRLVSVLVLKIKVKCNLRRYDNQKSQKTHHMILQFIILL